MSGVGLTELPSLPTSLHGVRLVTTTIGSWVVVTAQGQVDTDDTSLFQGVLNAALERGRGWLIVDLSGVELFEVLPLAVLAQVRARAVAAGGQLRLVAAENGEGILAELDRARWNINSDLANALQTP
jgi:anti-anti-sigma factor